MIEAIYRRELNRSYMVIRNENPVSTQGYAYRMMERNRFRKLLPCRERHVDGESCFYYDISSRQPLQRLYEGRRLGMEQLTRILEGIAAVLEEMGEYLLDGKYLLLEPDFLFADVETEELFFCFHPGREAPANPYGPLADYFLECVDHGEEAAVKLAYQFYKLSKSEYFVLASIFPYLERERTHKVEAGTLQEIGIKKQMDQAETYQEETYVANAPIKTQAKERVSEERTPRCKKKGIFARLKGMAKRREEPGREQEEEASLWDIYADRLKASDVGETIYFADLKKIRPENAGAPFLLCLASGRKILLEDLPVTVGKMEDRAGLVLKDGSVSRLHAKIFEEDGDIWVTDLNSRNGTQINERKLAPNEVARLSQGDEICFGRERFRFGFIDSREY